jgi:hypothetical protein
MMDVTSNQPVERKVQDVLPQEPLTTEEESKVRALLKEIDEKYEQIPKLLKAVPEVQEECLTYLLDAEYLLAQRPLPRREILYARIKVTRVNILLTRSATSLKSVTTVIAIIYLAAILVALAYWLGWFKLLVDPNHTDWVLGVPLPIWAWSAIGSFTSMLLRAGQFPFVDTSEAYRWLLFRPIVGVVMGVLTYLMVVTGLLVFAGSVSPKSPELLQVLAFVGSFSDTLSINLLQRILGQFQTIGKGGKSQEQKAEGSIDRSKQES